MSVCLENRYSHLIHIVLVTAAAYRRGVPMLVFHDARAAYRCPLTIARITTSRNDAVLETLLFIQVNISEDTKEHTLLRTSLLLTFCATDNYRNFIWI